MTQEKMIDAVTELDSDILDRYFLVKQVMKGKKKPKKNIWVKRVSISACFALILITSLWLFMPYPQTSEQVEIVTTIKYSNDSYLVYQQIRDMSNFDKLTLESKIGELYRESETLKFYKLKGRSDIAQLIVVSDDGDTRLFRFSDIDYWEKDAEPCSFGFILENIFDVKSADDIKSIKFEKSNFSKTDISQKVKVDAVTVTDDERIKKIFHIFAGLIDTEITVTEWINQHSEEYLNGTLPLAIQTVRKVTMEFESGTSIELQFDPHNKNLRLKGTNNFEGFAEEDVNWLIELAKINMKHVDYGTEDHEVNGGEGAETETPRPAN